MNCCSAEKTTNVHFCMNESFGTEICSLFWHWQTQITRYKIIEIMRWVFLSLIVSLFCRSGGVWFKGVEGNEFGQRQWQWPVILWIKQILFISWSTTDIIQNRMRWTTWGYRIKILCQVSDFSLFIFCILSC